MNLSDLTADLPAPREDEPSTLRQDIADELADHLACAVRREQLREGLEGGSQRSEVGGQRARESGERGDELSDGWRAQSTLQRVLARFGDPRAVARKLWWDAMREQIMKERLLTGLTVVAILACCGIAGLMWQMQTAQRDMLRESQAQNAKLIEQFQAALANLKSAPANAAPSEWNQLTVKCTFDAEDGAPAAGVEVSFRGSSETTQRVPADTQISDANGMIDFGKVLYGNYEMSCRTPDRSYSQFTVAVRPGQDKTVNVVCPNSAPPQQPISFDFHPPEPLTSKDVYYIAVIERAYQSVGNLSWSPSWDRFTRPCYVLDKSGQVLGQVEADAARTITQLSGGGMPVSARDFLRLLTKLRISPVTELPGYSVGGEIAAFEVDDKNSNESPGPVPPLKLIGQNATALGRIYLDESKTLKLSGNPSEFWRQVASFTETQIEIP